MPAAAFKSTALPPEGEPRADQDAIGRSTEQDDKCLVRELHEDVLADVLRHLPPRGLAVARCVCKAWRAAIDGSRLLRAELLPLSLGGMFVDFNVLSRTEFFSPSPSRGGGGGGAATVSGDLDFTLDTSVIDHCNGLVLLFSCVANPATRQWAELPEQPPPRTATEDAYYELPYLVFDPTLSPYYEVFLIPVVPDWADLDPVTLESEWPPPLFETHVFSSRTGRWEERSYVREGDAAGTMADMQRAMLDQQRYGVYWRGALYVHCQNDFFFRISASDGNNKYQVIKHPMGIEPNEHPKLHLGRSKNGVYCAVVDLKFRLRVWFLVESSAGRMEWVLKHQNNLKHLLASPEYTQQDHGPWILEDINYYEDYYDGDRRGDDEERVRHNNKLKYHSYVTLLGFLPFKEIVFLNSTMERGVSYDLNSSKVEDLGNMLPKHYNCIAGHHGYIRASFPYTPCWMEDPLPASSTSVKDDARLNNIIACMMYCTRYGYDNATINFFGMQTPMSLRVHICIYTPQLDLPPAMLS